MFEKLPALLGWKIVLAIILGILMSFAPKWLNRDIETVEKAIGIPVIEFDQDGDTSRKK